MAIERHLVLVEASGIQSFIFDTNKRRENVGASQLVDSVGEWTAEELTHLVPGCTRQSRIPDGPTDAAAAELLTSAAASISSGWTPTARARTGMTIGSTADSLASHRRILSALSFSPSSKATWAVSAGVIMRACAAFIASAQRTCSGRFLAGVGTASG
ncbi:hypothetical protein [Candidatus Protofrankia californiensis]|uniref:hypothetical protein n=1 Tax=Candidatus Protofrankia californiensis TaxID=1839754 RepID=UPI001041BBA8|nr:hypothetical protein [Candidatus Protofrankia californiensis]